MTNTNKSTDLLRLKSTAGTYTISTVEFPNGRFETMAFGSGDEVAQLRTDDEAQARKNHREVRLSLLGKLPACRANTCKTEVEAGREYCADHRNYPEIS